MLVAHGDWMPLGNADEQKPAKDGTVEAWARSDDNPVGGWYGLRKGYRGRFGNYVPPLLERLGLAEVEHNPRNNRMRGALARRVPECPRQDSNLRIRLRRPTLYPLSYGGEGLEVTRLVRGSSGRDVELRRRGLSRSS